MCIFITNLSLGVMQCVFTRSHEPLHTTLNYGRTHSHTNIHKHTYNVRTYAQTCAFTHTCIDRHTLIYSCKHHVPQLGYNTWICARRKGMYNTYMGCVHTHKTLIDTQYMAVFICVYIYMHKHISIHIHHLSPVP